MTDQPGKGAPAFLGLTVALRAALPNVDTATAEDLLHKAHQVCPCSRATRGNIEVTLAVE